jgi:esterase/lipase superfamily enzyme
MSILRARISARRAVSIFCLSLLLPLGAALTGCSDAPKLPNVPKSEADKTPGPTAGAKPPEDVDEGYGSGDGAKPDIKTGEATPPKSVEPPPVIVGQPKPAPAAEPAPEPESPAQPKSTDEAAGSPPPPPAPASPAPAAPSPSPGDSASTPPASGGATPTVPGGTRDGVLSRSLGQAAKPPAAATVPKAFDLVPVFYGTDRVVEPNAKRLQYGTERGHKLQLGRALVTVPDTHKVPNIERPWVVELPYFKYKIYEEKEDPAKHFTMQEIGALTKEQMLVYVKERLAKSTTFKDHAFVFVHGFNTSFDAAIYRTAQIAYDLKFDGAPFVYSWPSGGKVASYTYDRGSAEQAEPHLAEFLDFVIKQSGAKSISLIAHSMGNEVLLRVLERMRPAVPKGVVISQVILAAPDVDRDKFTNIAREITSFAKGVTLYAASNDRALSYSARFWGGVPRAGDVPASGPLIVAGVDTIDVTALSTESLSLNHSGYAENKTLLNDIAQLLQTGLRPPDKREPLLKKIDSPAGTFWRYPAAVP